jgi:hypothetical protein
MIQVQDLDVRLAAVDARVLEQVRGQVFANPFDQRRFVACSVGFVFLAIQDVPLSRAFSTTRLEAVVRCTALVELADGLQFLAAAADLEQHLGPRSLDV